MAVLISCFKGSNFECWTLWCPLLFYYLFSRGSVWQLRDTESCFRQRRDKRGAGSEGRAREAFDVWWLNTALNYTLSQSLTTESGNEGTRKEAAWRKNSNKPIGEGTPASWKKSPFSALFSGSFFQRHTHWEPSWLDIIFLSGGLMIGA